MNVNNGFGDLLAKLDKLEPAVKSDIEALIAKTYADNPDVAMVDSDKGITNLHVPSDVIIDASIPAMVRASGQMWNKDGDQQDTKIIIPDSTYAPYTMRWLSSVKSMERLTQPRWVPCQTWV